MKVLPLDTSSEYKEPPSDGQLLISAQQYIADNDLATPKISLKVGFVQLEQTEEYKGLALLERVNLCDYVTVAFPRLGVNAKAECVKMTYNVLLDRVESVELGDAIQTVADTIAENSLQSTANATGLSSASQAASSAASTAARAAAQSLSVMSNSGSNRSEIANGHFRSSDGTHTLTITGVSINVDGDEHPVKWIQSGSNFYLGA